MSNLQIFKNEKFGEVRVAEFDGVIWFAGKDVANMLGYSNTNKAILQHVDEEDRKIMQLSDFQEGNKMVPSSKGSKIGVITESGVYSLIFGSDLPAAKEFKRWVTSEVIPTIRKTGGYMIAKAEETPEELLARALAVAQNTINRQKAFMASAEMKALQNEKQMEQQAQKVLFAEAVEASRRSILISELAKLISQNGVETGQNRLFIWMRDNGYLGRRGDYYNIPTQRAMDMGLFEIKKTSIVKPDGTTLVTTTPKVTGRGQVYFINKFLKR